MRTVIFHLGAIIACAMAVLAITRRNPFAVILALAASLGALGVASLALGAYALGFTQILVHAGGVFVLLVAGLLLADGRGAEGETKTADFSFIGPGAALLLGVVIAVKFTPVTEFVIHVAPFSWRELVGQVIADGAPGEAFAAFALAGLLAAGTILGVRLATRAEEERAPLTATGSRESTRADG